MRNKLQKMIGRRVLLLIVSLLLVSIWLVEKSKWIPAYAAVFYDMGLSCEGKCEPQEQLRYFQKAVGYGPHLNDSIYNDRLSDAYFRSALIHKNMGNRSEALNSFVKAIELNAHNTMAYYYAGMHYFKNGDYNLAIGYLYKGQSQSGIPDDTAYYLALSFFEAQRYDLAALYFQSFITTTPYRAAEIYPMLAESYLLDDNELGAWAEFHGLRAANMEDRAKLLEKGLLTAFESGKFKQTNVGR